MQACFFIVNMMLKITKSFIQIIDAYNVIKYIFMNYFTKMKYGKI